MVMATTTNQPYVKFTYFKDPESPRTVTVARLLDGDRMYIAWCVNKMQRHDCYEDYSEEPGQRFVFINGRSYAYDKHSVSWVGDTFNKKIARDITKGRVTRARLVNAPESSVIIDDTKRKIDQIVEYMYVHAPKFIQQIIHRSVVERNRLRLTGRLGD
jgi:hypothetical protein